MGLLLQNCGGGGGGGGAVQTTTNFVNNTVSQLDGSASILSSYSSNISALQSILSGGNLGGLSDVFTAPTTTDKQRASELLSIISNSRSIWTQVSALIDSQDNATKYRIYNSNDYKVARASYLFLIDYVQPIASKISNGQNITLTEFNRIANQSIALETMTTVKNTDVATETATLISTVNTVSTTETLDPVVSTAVTESVQYTETTYTDSAESTSTANGSPTTSTSTNDTSTSINNGDGTTTTTTTRYTTTVTTTPVITTTTKTRTYTDKVYKDVTTTTTTTPQTKKTYVDGTTQTVAGTATSTSTTAKTLVSTGTRTETITVSESTTNITSENTDSGVVVSVVTTSTAYTENDPNLGTKTPGYSSNQASYRTNEYLDRDANGWLQGWENGGKKQVKAEAAYSRGWTGNGVTIAVVDTGYDIDHTEFQGQVVATRDYTGTGMQDTVGHGTHVLGSMVAKKDGAGTHGVAYDAKAVVVKITNSTYVNMNDAASGLAWAASQGAVAGNLSANSNYDPTFYNSLVQLSDGTYKSTDSRYDYKNGVYYNLQDPNTWKSATDQGMIIVNSAGNQGLTVAANPGYFATATDANGNLILGGKMLIVGAVDQNGRIASWSNKAGTICHDVNTANNTCNDTYKVSDFYILAPGWTYSTKNDGTYGAMAGTSMAAPYVTGGVAIVSQMWPYMKGENIVRLLTTTACKSECLPGYNVNTHGSGLMDLDAATRPVGATGIPTTGRTTSSVSTVSLSGTGGSGSSLSAIAKSGALSKVMIVDEFARDFYVDMARGVTVKDKRKFSDVQVASYSKSYLPFQQQYGSFDQGGQYPIFVKGLEFGIYNNVNSTSGDWSTNLGYKWEMAPGVKLRTMAGYMNEKKTWLGNESSGALAVGGDNGSQFAQLGIEYTLGNNTFSWDVGRSYTDVNTVSNSVITSISNIQSDSMKLGWERKIDDTSKWGITYSLPSRVTRGTANLHIPYATTLDGEVQYQDVQTSLKQTSTEKNIGVYYAFNGEGDTDWKTSFSLEYRKNVAGVEGDNKIVPALQISKKFYGACMSLFGMQNERPGCQKIRAEEKLSDLLKQKGKEKEIAELKEKMIDIDMQIAKIHGKSDREIAQLKVDRKMALGWNR